MFTKHMQSSMPCMVAKGLILAKLGKVIDCKQKGLQVDDYFKNLGIGSTHHGELS